MDRVRSVGLSVRGGSYSNTVELTAYDDKGVIISSESVKVAAGDNEAIKLAASRLITSLAENNVVEPPKRQGDIKTTLSTSFDAYGALQNIASKIPYLKRVDFSYKQLSYSGEVSIQSTDTLGRTSIESLRVPNGLTKSELDKKFLELMQNLKKQ